MAQDDKAYTLSPSQTAALLLIQEREADIIEKYIQPLHQMKQRVYREIESHARIAEGSLDTTHEIIDSQVVVKQQ